jgi:predicted MPP superfamily phosphohydrolase
MFLFICSIIVLLLLLGFYLANKNTYQVSFKKIEPYKLNLKNHNSNLHILHLSDIHLENLSITPEQLYANVKDEKIDLIALTGDFLDRKKSIPKLIPYLQLFNQLNPRYGVFAVLGNHDYVLKGKNLHTLTSLLEEHHVTVLQNNSTTIDVNGNALNIIGVDDFSTNRSDLNMSYQNIKRGFNLVLTHDPNIVLTMKNYHFDYLLSGHFHGGQIHWPKPYHLVKMGKLARLNIIRGLHLYNDKPFYISEGLGQTGINIRIGSTPEITMHCLNISLQEIKHAVVI